MIMTRINSKDSTLMEITLRKTHVADVAFFEGLPGIVQKGEWKEAYPKGCGEVTRRLSKKLLISNSINMITFYLWESKAST